MLTDKEYYQYSKIFRTVKIFACLGAAKIKVVFTLTFRFDFYDFQRIEKIK